MKIAGNEIRPGNVIEHKDHLWTAVKVQHVKPGKGGAYAQVELRNLRNGAKLNERFRSAENVERVRLEQRTQQFLYASGGMLVFMDAESFEQTELPESILQERLPFLQEGMNVQIEYFGLEPLSISLPEQVACAVAETEPTVKGQTAASSYKPATLENGFRIMVPPFIERGETVIVDMTTLEYAKRA